MTDILVVTVNDVAGARISRVIGPVYGTSVRSRSIVAKLKDPVWLSADFTPKA